MAMRLSGLMSGMDTESIIQQLVEAKSTKVTTAKKSQTKLSWKQDAWKELNTKLKNLQSKFLSNMRFSSAYTKKTTKVSNPNAVSVITGENAVNGVQSLEIDQLAKTGYMTGGVVKRADGTDGEITAMTTLKELGFTGQGGSINVKTASGSVDIKVTEDTKISDVLTQLKSAGLNASFDAKWKRFSISSKESGAANDFSVTAVDAQGQSALAAMKLQVNLNDDEATRKEYEEYAKYVGADDTATAANMSALINADIASRRDAYLKSYEDKSKELESARDAAKAITDKYTSLRANAEAYDDDIKTANDNITQWNKDLAAASTDEEKKTIQDKIDAELEKVKNLTEEQTAVKNLASHNDTITKLNADIADIKTYVDVDAGTETAALTNEVTKRYVDKANMAKQVWEAYDPTDKTATGATKVSGQDARIYLNGAEYENSTNTFEINGLTFTALNETKGEQITVTTEQDVDGIYDMVKNFLKEYNSIINEMDKLYNAESAKGYEPLSDEEREAMSDADIEKYEKKIKDALLRRDENLSSVSSAMKSVMSAGVEVNGKTMYLFDFGIDTLSYFTAADNEKNAYHIDGDPDDVNTAGNADQLKGMIASDPDTVISFFTKLSQNLYDKMSDLSKSVDGYRSYGSFYDDKKMKSDYDDYTSKIKDLEDKLNDYEDKWYSKFAAMESAMAKMQQNSSAVTALLGGS
ncbi:MAG: flagellar filament capping protein FliD [Lachnospiraceae bacterium]|nr:flagellar filament capping protein FliD [Lachnospiraceae bacterium]MCM1239626.1 flagellar filament capping protein FliD [Lachnospiraceae bacterium]MCM1302724.1 flagellar filament capping protein FliD [Butyrivibrio sp.]MCM1342444.1 flagellar filament capping protein FliD [Muribaculaceae bacterium]MCM1410250.1 flagellar filament capping protein FliD [Lachnospiraceae bacterium]